MKKKEDKRQKFINMNKTRNDLLSPTSEQKRLVYIFYLVLVLSTDF